MRTHHAFHRVQMLHKRHKFFFIVMMETFQEPGQIHRYTRILRMKYDNDNQNGKIYIFVPDDIQVTILTDSDQ